MTKIILEENNNIYLEENMSLIGKYEKFGNVFLFKPFQSYFGEEIKVIGENLIKLNQDEYKKEILEKLEKLKDCNNSNHFNFVAFNRFKKDLEEYLKN